MAVLLSSALGAAGGAFSYYLGSSMPTKTGYFLSIVGGGVFGAILGTYYNESMDKCLTGGTKILMDALKRDRKVLNKFCETVDVGVKNASSVMCTATGIIGICKQCMAFVNMF